MVSTELTDRQAALLRPLLTNVLSDLRLEAAATDLQDLRDRLAEREALLNDPIQGLAAGASVIRRATPHARRRASLLSWGTLRRVPQAPRSLRPSELGCARSP